MSKKPTFFWASYADLMTSLFFIMLVLFVLTVVMLKKQAKATEDELTKIKAIQESVNKIDTSYFEYKGEYKKHILRFQVQFADTSAIIPEYAKDKLYDAGQAIKSFLKNAATDSLTKDAKYLLVIEGQASRDMYKYNDVLSFRRALSLKSLWQNDSIDVIGNCELIVAGSGISGIPRENNEKLNQRFLIHIIPKPGIIKNDTIKPTSTQ